MLANTYKEINNSKITITKADEVEYCDLSAKSFIEPKGMHIFSIHRSSIYNSSTPLFEANPTTTYLNGIAVDKNNTLADNESVLADARGRISFISGAMIPTTTQDINLNDLQAKMNKSFGITNNAGVISFRPKTTTKYYYGFNLTNNKITIHGGEKLVIKLIAKLSSGYSLKVKYNCGEPLNYSSCDDGYIAGNMYKGFIVDNSRYISEAPGTDKWETYTFAIYNPHSTDGYLNSLTFYVGLTNSDSAIDIITNQFDKYLYLCYMDFLVLPSNYIQLEYYNPLENVSSVKNGTFTNVELFEESQLEASTVITTKFKHDIVFKQNIISEEGE